MNETLAVFLLFAVRILVPVVLLLAIGIWVHWRQKKAEQKYSK